MSRSGYCDDGGEGTWGLVCWRGAVNSAIKGKRGQAALKELATAMDAMPVKTLAAESLVSAEGEFCTLGVLGNLRGLDMGAVDPEDWDAVARLFGIAPAMVREIVYENDERTDTREWIDVEICGPVRPHWPDYGRHTQTVRVVIPGETVGRQRWQRMRRWVDEHLAKEA